jgi:putative ABC transport system permease protein
LRAAATALVALTGFALPPLLNLRNVPPLRVLRSDADANALSRTTVICYAIAASVFVAPWGDGEWNITGWSLMGLSAGLCVLVVAALMVIKLAKWQRNRLGLVWRFGVANIARRGALTIVQISALGIGLVSLLVLGIVRTDLLDSWISSLPENAPNQFLINIQAEDLPGLREFFKRHKLEPPEFYPMIRGRLTALNDQPIASEDYADPRARRLVDREFNLSSANELKPYNKLIAGKWWHADGNPAQFSVEREIAETLGIVLGDSLTYRVAEREVRGIVTNLRAVQWDSMQVNFFVEAPPDLLVDYPATFITSFRLDPADFSLLHALVREYPSVTVIDVGALVGHIRTIMNRSAATIEFVFLFTLAAGILVLIAAIQATQRERIFESALLKTLGTRRGLILRIMGAEFVVIGLIAGGFSGCMAVFSAWLVATQILEIAYSPDPSVVLTGAAAGVVSVTLVGSLAILSALRQPAASVLRYRN